MAFSSLSRSMKAIGLGSSDDCDIDLEANYSTIPANKPVDGGDNDLEANHSTIPAIKPVDGGDNDLEAYQILRYLAFQNIVLEAVAIYPLRFTFEELLDAVQFSLMRRNAHEQYNAQYSTKPIEEKCLEIMKELIRKSQVKTVADGVYILDKYTRSATLKKLSKKTNTTHLQDLKLHFCSSVIKLMLEDSTKPRHQDKRQLAVMLMGNYPSDEETHILNLSLEEAKKLFDGCLENLDIIYSLPTYKNSEYVKLCELKHDLEN